MTFVTLNDLFGFWLFPMGPFIYYVSIILDFFWPTHYVSRDTVLNVSKNYHFLDPPTQFNADVIYGCFLLLYFWLSSCRLGNCMSVWTQYENFNFIPAKKAIFKGQKMTSFPEIKSCYTKQIKTYSFVQSILTPPRKISF